VKQPIELALRKGILLFLAMGLLSTSVVNAQFFFTGPSGGDFFDELNWTLNPDGTGANPAAGSIDPDVNISETLFIDGDTVTAAGPDPGGSTSDNGDLDISGFLGILPDSLLNVTVGELRVTSVGSFASLGSTINISGQHQRR